MTTPPSPEAVEAAMIFIDGPGRIKWNEAACFLLSAAIEEDKENTCTQLSCAARILAAEVERLRAQADAVCEWSRQGQDGENGYRAKCGQWGIGTSR